MMLPKICINVVTELEDKPPPFVPIESKRSEKSLGLEIKGKCILAPLSDKYIRAIADIH